MIWIIWDAIIEQSKKVGGFVEKIEKSLLELFCVKYSAATSKKRKYLLYFAVELLTEPVATNVDLIEASKKEMIGAINENIDLIYKQIKKNEHSPNTDYLFMGTADKKANFDQSMRKLELVQSMDFIPRTGDL